MHIDPKGSAAYVLNDTKVPNYSLRHSLIPIVISVLDTEIENCENDNVNFPPKVFGFKVSVIERW